MLVINGQSFAMLTTTVWYLWDGVLTMVTGLKHGVSRFSKWALFWRQVYIYWFCLFFCTVFCTSHREDEAFNAGCHKVPNSTTQEEATLEISRASQLPSCVSKVWFCILNCHICLYCCWLTSARISLKLLLPVAWFYCGCLEISHVWEESGSQCKM